MHVLGPQPVLHNLHFQDKQEARVGGGCPGWHPSAVRVVGPASRLANCKEEEAQGRGNRNRLGKEELKGCWGLGIGLGEVSRGADVCGGTGRGDIG